MFISNFFPVHMFDENSWPCFGDPRINLSLQVLKFFGGLLCYYSSQDLAPSRQILGSFASPVGKEETGQTSWGNKSLSCFIPRLFMAPQLSVHGGWACWLKVWALSGEGQLWQLVCWLIEVQLVDWVFCSIILFYSWMNIRVHSWNVKFKHFLSCFWVGLLLAF